MSERKETLSRFMLAPVLILVQWMIPGMGYILLGQKARGLTVGITILTLFVLGLYIGGAKVVIPADSFAVADILAKPWYIGQCLVGPAGIITGMIAQNPAFHPSHGRTNEIGLLYTAIAGMLNLFTLIDLARLHKKGTPQ